MRFAVIGGDRRSAALAELLLEDGHKLRSFALGKGLTKKPAAKKPAEPRKPAAKKPAAEKKPAAAKKPAGGKGGGK